MTQLIEILTKHQAHYQPVLPPSLQYGKALILDLSGKDKYWLTVDLQSVSALQTLTQELMQAQQAVIAVGRYGEDRAFLYQRSDLFQLCDARIRSIHLGIDLTVPVGTPIFAPLAGNVHSAHNNSGFGDYGPTLILQHQLVGHNFFTLYGHLSLVSIMAMPAGKSITAGETIGAIGDSDVNGGWPPHLHFQIIENLWNHEGDFPGVIDAQQASAYLMNCPNPNLILQIAALNSSFNLCT